MTMDFGQWMEILSKVNDDGDLSEDNVIEKIKEKLKAENKNEYRQWGEADFDVNHPFEGDMKSTLLHLAACSEEARVVCALLEVKEIDVSAVAGRLEWNPLHEAVNCICKESVNELLKSKKVNVNAVDKDGQTPLHRAVAVSTKGVIKALVQNGAADLSLRDNKGQTPRDLARNDDIKKLLEEAEKEQLRKPNEEKNDLPQGKDTTHPLGTTSAIKKGVYAGGTTALLGTAAAIVFFATGIISVELIPIVIVAATIAATALVVGGATYVMSKPSTKMNGVEEQRLLGNEQEV